MFKGSFTALVTPFLPDGGVDEKAFRALVEWQIAEGADGLVPVGTTGESPTLTHEEHRRVVEICIGTAAGRVPVIAGGGPGSGHRRRRIEQYGGGGRTVPPRGRRAFVIPDGLPAGKARNRSVN